MQTYNDYLDVASKIDAVAKQVGIDALLDDECTNIENAGSSDNYDLLIKVAIDTFGQRCESYGLNANDYGFKY